MMMMMLMIIIIIIAIIIIQNSNSYCIIIIISKTKLETMVSIIIIKRCDETTAHLSLRRRFRLQTSFALKWAKKRSVVIRLTD